MLYLQRPARHNFGETNSVTDIAAGHGFTLIAVKPKGESGPVVFGCGYNTKSQLGTIDNDWFIWFETLKLMLEFCFFVGNSIY